MFQHNRTNRRKRKTKTNTQIDRNKQKRESNTHTHFGMAQVCMEKIRIRNISHSSSISEPRSMSECGWNPGVFIDIDGVVLQGGKPFEWTVEAIQALWKNKIPFVFVTNGTYCSSILVDSLRKTLGLPVTSDHVIVAPSPCKELTEYHDKRVLVCCQEDSIGLISELGFTDYLTVEELADIFPDLDYVDHNKRKALLSKPLSAEKLKAQADFKPIDVILLLGEPINWECSLQLLIDVLMTNGDPRSKFKFVPNPHLPIIACNKDLTFKGAAALPRFGHGAFLECLESLYKKITNNELEYEDIMGKPYLVTYEYAANQIQKLSPNGRPINKFYIIGDNPEVDIKGANMYKEHLEGTRITKVSSHQSSRKHSFINDVGGSNVFNQPVESILVCTGVYNPQNDLLYNVRKIFNSPQMHFQNNHQHTFLPHQHQLHHATPQSQIHFHLDEVDQQATGNESSSGVESSESGDNLSELSKSKSDNLDTCELSTALATPHSFISYFDDRLNLPDHIFDNLKHSVDYILKSNIPTNSLKQIS